MLRDCSFFYKESGAGGIFFFFWGGGACKKMGFEGGPSQKKTREKGGHLKYFCNTVKPPLNDHRQD